MMNSAIQDENSMLPLGDMYDEIEIATNMGSWLFNLQTGSTYFSKNFYRILQLTEQKHVRTLSDAGAYMHPDERKKLQRTEEQMIQRHRIPDYVYKMTAADGSTKILRQTSKQIAREDGSSYLQGMLQLVCVHAPLPGDIDEDTLHKKLKLAEKIYNASIDREMVIDTDYTIISWNHYNEIVTGITKAEACGKSIFDVFPNIDSCPDIIKAMSHAMRGYTVFVPADKSAYEEGYFENHFIPLKDDDDKVIGVLNIKHDVAHRVKAENELKALNKSLAKKNKELKQRNSELRSFTHITSHDLKEPLRKIYTFAEMILNKESEGITPNGKMYFRRIQAAAQRMSLLTDDILTFSQLDIDDTPLSNLDLNQILILARQNLYALIESKGAKINSVGLPVFVGHRSMLIQLFQNILSNALKFQKDGNTPVVNISATRIAGKELKHADASQDAEYLKISFTDNGIGFEKKYTDRIFQMFMRLNSNDTYSGSGIGLALCKKIADLHHGFITAESQPDKGSTFHVHLQINE